MVILISIRKTLDLMHLGPVGDVVEEWICKGAYVKSANFGDFDWTSDTPSEYFNLSIRMDYAILNY